ncbi:hypothetical protein COV20_00905 [Candidatus Woesearchaeota archaeon CG10_big_fil_rev_8_21_14_0_10_45_16]|nr:MAG: hypothetical protein COV20_00905 [Candidatus Woesearchaeota archaeon CG10_big_fil_rev_8_21_14_0_10_45_16]
MTYDKRIDWDDLPHDDKVGHGREGLVLRLDKRRCVKVYSPERAFRAEDEFNNYGRLRDAGFLVPEAEEFVEVHIGGRRVELPGKCEFMGIGLYHFDDVESVPGIIKEFFPGVPYGRKKPNLKDIRGLIDYLNRLHAEGFTFDDGIAPDFISSDRGTALVDCSTLMDKVECEQRFNDGFEYASPSYQRRIWSDLTSELRYNGFMTLGFDVRLTVAKWMSERKNAR